MSKADPRVVSAIVALLEDELSCTARRPIVLGICGSQGSGKSTLAVALAEKLEEDGRTCEILSLDDLYLPKSARERLAREVHPLLATRGPPGTHDVSLGIEVIDLLRAGSSVALPRFDKARDDRAVPSDWPRVEENCDVLLFEGWCVGAVPQDHADLAQPINDLEALEDTDGVWRRHTNTALAGSYQDLFSRIDRLVLLQAPGFEVVCDWRMQQEHDLRAAHPDGSQLMDDGQVARFVQHYERITRHILAEMPPRADLLVSLEAGRNPVSILPRT